MLDKLLTKFIRLFFTKEELSTIDKIRELSEHGVTITHQNGGVQLEFRDDEAREWYYDQVFGKFKGKL